MPACPVCGAVGPAVWVHGHLQCAWCGYVLEPCCQGMASDELLDLPPLEPQGRVTAAARRGALPPVEWDW